MRYFIKSAQTRTTTLFASCQGILFRFNGLSKHQCSSLNTLMDTLNFFTQIKSQLSLENGVSKWHVAIAVTLVVLILVYFTGRKPQLEPITTDVVVESPGFIADAVLKALYEQNIDKRLEYAESKPTIINSLKKYLYRFDSFMQTDPESAKAPLSIIRRRLLYLTNKGLDVSDAEAILNEHVIKYIEHGNAKEGTE